MCLGGGGVNESDIHACCWKEVGGGLTNPISMPVVEKKLGGGGGGGLTNLISMPVVEKKLKQIGTGKKTNSTVSVEQLLHMQQQSLHQNSYL